MSIVILNLKKFRCCLFPLLSKPLNSLQVHKNKTLKIDWRSSNLETCIQWNAIFALVRSFVFVLLLGCWHFFFAVNGCLTYPKYLQVSIIKHTCMHFQNYTADMKLDWLGWYHLIYWCFQKILLYVCVTCKYKSLHSNLNTQTKLELIKVQNMY